MRRPPRRSRPPLRCYLEHVRARQCHETGDLLDQIKAPTLCMVGGADHGERFRHGPVPTLRRRRQLAERIPGATFQVIAGGAHAYLWQKAAEGQRGGPRLPTAALSKTDHPYQV